MNDIEYILNKPAGSKIKIAFVYSLSIVEPLGMGYLYAFLRERFPGIIIDFFDPKVDHLDALHDFSPNFVFYSIMSGQYEENLIRNRMLKKALNPFISVFGGAHPTYFPEMINEDGVDIICRGEGEKPLESLLEAVISSSDIHCIPGLWIKSGDKIHKNNIPELISQLDDLPFPEREAFYKKSNHLRNYTRKSISPARGCTFNCSYCHNGGLKELLKGKGRIFRYRSPESVISEALELKSRGNLNFIEFSADIFPGIYDDWLEEFTERYVKEINIPYHVSLRAEFINPKIAERLKRSGCASVGMAIEHGNYEYRKKYLSRRMTNKQLIEGSRILESNGIRVATPTMIGLPFTNIKDDIDTLKLVCEAGSTYANPTIFQPYPGVPLSEICIKHGLIESQDAMRFKAHAAAPAHIKGIDYKAVVKLRNVFTMLQLLNRLFNIDIERTYKILPGSIIFKIINMGLNYICFNRIYNYKRGTFGRIRELYVALREGAYGITVKKNKIYW